MEDHNKYNIVLPNIPLNIVVARWNFKNRSSLPVTVITGGTYDYEDDEHDKIYIYIQDTSGENFLGETVKPIIKRIIDGFKCGLHQAYIPIRDISMLHR